MPSLATLLGPVHSACGVLGVVQQLPDSLRSLLLRTSGAAREESACLKGSVHTRSRISSSPHRYCSRRMYLATSGSGVPHTGCDRWGVPA